MGVTGDFAGSLTSKRVEQARVGSLQGEENRVFPREIELSFFGQIDPYARAEVRVEAGDELEEDGTRSLGVELAEANLTLMAIPWGFQPKLGRMRLRWGYLNEFHQHDRPFIDNPNVYVRFFGEEGLVENGAEIAWVAPTPLLPPGHPGDLRRRQRRRLRRRDSAGSARHRPAAHLLRADGHARHPAGRLGDDGVDHR